MPTLIEVSNPKELPARIICFAYHSVEDMRKWATHKGTKRVWWYQHHNSKMITAAILREEAK